MNFSNENELYGFEDNDDFYDIEIEKKDVRHGTIMRPTREQFEAAKSEFLFKKEELFQQKGKGIYSPVIGKYVTIGCLMLSKPPVTETSPVDEIELFHQIIDIISKVTETGLMLTPERIWFGLGLSEAEFFQAKSDPFDYRNRVLTWAWHLTDSIMLQNIQLGNASLDTKKWLDITRSRGEFIPTTEKVNIAMQTTIIENEQLKGREAAERLLGKNYDRLLEG